MRSDLKAIGKKCKEHREKLHILQQEVADDLNYSKETISSFETGRNNNALIFAWYIEKGVLNNEEKN